MRIVTFASGSSGNCALISERGTHLLIDAGISMRRISCCLKDFGITPGQLSGVLITHEHSDHICGLGTMLKKYDMPLYAPRAAAEYLKWNVAGAADVLRVIVPGETVEVGNVSVTPFRTMHDTPESVGYRIEGDSAVGFCTDLGCVTDEVRTALTGVDAAVIEANHDEDMLRYGPYPAQLKRRILSDHGHLSNECSGGLAVFLAEHGTKYIVLGHLSRENNTPLKAHSTVAEALEHAEKRADLAVAPASGYMELLVGRAAEMC